MRIDDICLVVSDVDRSDAFYSTVLGLERRMRNVRFADFRLGEGARLAMWVEESIAETVGPTYPTGAGMPFTVTLELEDAAHDALADPDGFTVILGPSPRGARRLAAVHLTVAELERSAAFVTTLGFAEVRREARSREYAAGTMALTIALDAPVGDGVAPGVGVGVVPGVVPGVAPAPPAGAPDAAGPNDHPATWPRRVMLAIELETGPEVDALYDELRAQGLVDSGPPRVYEWGSRSVYFVDHDGYIWEIYAWVETLK